MTASFTIDGVELAGLKPVKPAEPMRAATLTQPWAGLVAAQFKPIENRSRPMIKRADFHKPFAIHASREVDESVWGRIHDIAPDLFVPGTLHGDPAAEWRKLARVTSAVIAVATVVDVLDPSSLAATRPPYDAHELRWWFRDQHGYVLRHVRALATPVPCRGMLGFWTLPPEVERAVRSQLEAAP